MLRQAVILMICEIPLIISCARVLICFGVPVNECSSMNDSEIVPGNVQSKLLLCTKARGKYNAMNTYSDCISETSQNYFLNPDIIYLPMYRFNLCPVVL